jgi:hypothetical protein
MPAVGRAALVVAEPAGWTLLKLRAGGPAALCAVSRDCIVGAGRERVVMVLVGARRGPETATLPWVIGNVGRVLMGAALEFGLLGVEVPAAFISVV